MPEQGGQRPSVIAVSVQQSCSGSSLCNTKYSFII